MPWNHLGGTKWSGPDGREYTIEPMTITPEWAQEMLHGSDGEKESRNFRDLSEKHTRFLEDEFTSGRMKINGQTVVFDSDGYVRDGQKRLTACIRTGVPFDAIVVWGIASDVDDTIDDVQRRTVAQYLKKAEERNYNDLPSAIAWAWKMVNGRELSPESPRKAVAISYLNANPLIRESVSKAKACEGAGCPRSILAAVHHLAGEHNRVYADKFLDMIQTGVGIVNDSDPVNRFRQRMLQEHDRKSKAKLPTAEKLALLILTWNMWRDGRQVRCLKWTGVGPSAQPFPSLNATPIQLAKSA